MRTLFAELRPRGWLDNTVVILTADHGEEFFEHRGFGHGFTLFNEIVRIPLIFWYPRKWKGLRVEHPTSEVDLMPTILDLLGISPPPYLQGQSLLPMERVDQADRAIYGENIIWVSGGGLLQHLFVVRSNLKLVETGERGARTFALYDLEADPGESRNLLRDEPGAAVGLMSTLEQFKLSNQKREGLPGCQKAEFS